MKTNFEHFVSGYLECVLFCEDPQDECRKFSEEALNTARADCRLFLDQCGEEIIAQAIAELGEHAGSWVILGRDFWFTRAGHGTGFWDRDDLNVEPCATVYGMARYSHACYSPDGGTLGDLLTAIAYGTQSRISRFAHVSVYVEGGVVEFV